ncbi:MAG TPA: lamin tail domain-containing protein, partial [Chthoniobacteraceae bacterium]|nr:lamin tail domain-containing protein [Chthoniobacteraceae bacterium]
MSVPVRIALCALLTSFAVVSRGDVVINEIMYHPSSENNGEEFIELTNTSSVTIDLSGWRFTSGVSFIVPGGVTIAPGAYLVIAANPATFHAKYPGVTNFIGASGWAGQLSNSANKITLEDNLGNERDEVNYADDGDWAERRRDDPPDFGHRGWHWHSDADGSGFSLELLNANFDNALGQNWSASSTPQGTPGASNSRAAADIAPVIEDAQHFPLIPRSTETVTVTCRVLDDHPGPVTVQVHHRVDGAPAFATLAMFDDGVHGDALAGDGVFGAALPQQTDGTIVEFYFTAADSAGHTRIWPAPARDYTGTLEQSQNCLYQVDDANYAGAMPIYNLIMRARDKSELTQINTNSPETPPFPFQPNEVDDQTQSHARFNTTFISRDGTGAKLRYLTGARDRGNGSRTAQPMNFSVQFTDADPWNEATAINLNTQQTPWQLFGSAVYAKAGLVAPESRAVQVRWNGENDATGGGAPSFGFYVSNEFQDSNFADHHFPLDSGGNIYHAQRIFEGTTPGGTTIRNGADLSLIIPDAGETLSQVELYKLNYRKETNNSEDDWSDLVALTAALAKGHSGAAPNDPVTYDPDYLPAVQSKIDIAQFVRWFAVETFADNEETNLSNGDGDDYYLYIGKIDPRGKLSPHDLDTIFGRSGN